MRISGPGSYGNVHYANKVKRVYNDAKPNQAKDAVTFSNFGKDLAIAKKAVDKSADVRMDKVKDIKARIESGNYNISATQVADKLLENFNLL